MQTEASEANTLKPYLCFHLANLPWNERPSIFLHIDPHSPTTPQPATQHSELLRITQPKVQKALAGKNNILPICTVPIAATAAETDFKVIYTTSYPCIPILGISSKKSKCQLFPLDSKAVYRIASASKINE